MKKVITVIIIIACLGLMGYKLYSNKQKNEQEVDIVAQKDDKVAVRIAKFTQ